MAQKEYKIIKIIDGKHIVINAGNDDKVEKGDHFRIMGQAKTADAMVDPDTKENYGPLQPIKSHIVAETVFEKFTICSSIPKTVKLPSAATMFQRIEYPELNVNPEDITGGDITDNTPIAIGDTVFKDLGWSKDPIII